MRTGRFTWLLERMQRPVVQMAWGTAESPLLTWGTGCTTRRQEVCLGSLTSGPTFLSYPLAPVRQGSTTFQRSDARWGPSVQICEPIGRDVHFSVYSGNLKDSQLTRGFPGLFPSLQYGALKWDRLFPVTVQGREDKEESQPWFAPVEVSESS